MCFCYVFLPMHHPPKTACSSPPFSKGPPFQKERSDSLPSHPFLHSLYCFSSQFFWIFFWGVGEKRLITLLAGGNPRFSSKNICIFHPKTLHSSINDNPFPNKKKSAPPRTHLENWTKNFGFRKRGWIFTSKKSPTGPTESTPKKPVYLIALVPYL